jgi:hypothetical protein
MYALLILDMQVGLVHGPDKPWAGEVLVDTLNGLIGVRGRQGPPSFLPAI